MAGQRMWPDDAVRADRNDPPSSWSHFAVTKLTDDIYFGWPEGEAKPWFWHWCSTYNRWRGAGTNGHDLVEREPLHLEPSLLWPCCNVHGWVRDGKWTDA